MTTEFEEGDKKLKSTSALICAIKLLERSVLIIKILKKRFKQI